MRRDAPIYFTLLFHRERSVETVMVNYGRALCCDWEGRKRADGGGMEAEKGRPINQRRQQRFGSAGRRFVLVEVMRRGPEASLERGFRSTAWSHSHSQKMRKD